MPKASHHLHHAQSLPDWAAGASSRPSWRPGPNGGTLASSKRESADEEDGVDETEEELEDENDQILSQHFPKPIYINDHLTKPRAQLVKKCRDLKKKSISDTWVFDGRILVKDLHGRVHEVKRESFLSQITD